MTPEAIILRDIFARLGQRQDVRLFRNSIGHVVDSRGQHFNYGLCRGSADLIGIVKPRGRFLALEVKSLLGRATAEQLAFLDMVNNMGGVGRIVRSVAEAELAADEAGR